MARSFFPPEAVDLDAAALLDRYQRTQMVGADEWQRFVERLFATQPRCASDAQATDALHLLLRETRSLRNRRRPRRVMFLQATPDMADEPARPTHGWVQHLGFASWQESPRPWQLFGTPLPAAHPLNFAIAAASLEIALLNCSHVLLIEADTQQPSFWSAYACGRLAEHLNPATAFARWQTDTSDYMSAQTAPVLTNQQDVQQWLDAPRPNRREITRSADLPARPAVAPSIRPVLPATEPHSHRRGAIRPILIRERASRGAKRLDGAGRKAAPGAP